MNSVVNSNNGLQGYSQAKARTVRVSAQKARLIADLVRGKSVNTAIEILQFSPQKSAGIIKKVIISAVHNAESNPHFDPSIDIDDLRVKEIYVDKGASLKRFRARAKGRGAKIEKQTCHIVVTLAQ